MKPFVVNRYGRIVFPESFFPELDFSVFETLEQFAAVIRRDFEEKALSETDIVARVEARAYAGRYELLRDLALNLFWVNRYAMTMYEKRPTRWRDVPRQRDDVFLPVFKPWDGAELTAAPPPGADDDVGAVRPRHLEPAREERPGRDLGVDLGGVDAPAPVRGLTREPDAGEPDVERKERVRFLEPEHEAVGTARDPPLEPTAPCRPFERDEPEQLRRDRREGDREEPAPPPREAQPSMGGMRRTWPG